MTLTFDISKRLAEALQCKASAELQTIIEQQETIMAGITDIVAAFAVLKVSLTMEIEQINNKIAALQQNLAEGGTTEERDALLSDIQATTARIEGIIEDGPTEEPAGEGDGE